MRTIAGIRLILIFCVIMGNFLALTEAEEGRSAVPAVRTSRAGQSSHLADSVGYCRRPFAANQGQWADASVRFAMRRPGANLLITDEGLAIQLWRTDGGAPKATTVRARFLGANSVLPRGVHRTRTVLNYFTNGNERGHTGIATYEAIAYRGLYDRIDLRVAAMPAGLKLEYHVAPGGDWRDIVVVYEGAESLRLDEAGRLIIDTPLGEIIDEAPITYQEIDGRCLPVAGRFRLIGENACGVEITGPYDPTRTLIIDPYLGWSTYLGGSQYDGAYGLGMDAQGNVYVAAFTTSDDYPVHNAYDPTRGGFEDITVSKFAPDGSLVWSTYLGGTGYDAPLSMTVDAAGYIYLTGDPSYNDFPTPGGWRTDGSDVFVMKMSPNGIPIWGTYFDGWNSDWVRDIAVDAWGNVVITGYTYSDDLPTAGGWDPTHNGQRDAFVAKFGANGYLRWCTYLGGTGEEYGYGVTVDEEGNIYATGETGSDDFPTANAQDDTRDAIDAYVTKFSPAGQLLWSTFLGGIGAEMGTDIVADGAGNVYATGETTSIDMATANAYDTTYNGQDDTYVAKINADGDLLWCTYLGGWGGDLHPSIATDGVGNLYVAGRTMAHDFPTPHGWDTTFNGGVGSMPYDMYLAWLNSSGDLLWGTYLGGSRDNLTAYFPSHSIVATDGRGNVCVTDRTDSTDFPSSGGLYPTLRGDFDAFVTRFTGFPKAQRTAQPIVVGASVESPAVPFQLQDFQLDLGAGQVTHLLVRMTPLEGTGGWTLLGRRGEMPTRDTFDWSSERRTLQRTVELLIPSPAAGSLFFTVAYTDWNNQPGRFRIQCIDVERYFSDLSPREGGDGGEVTIVASGLGMTDPMAFELRRGPDTIPSLAVAALSPTEWAATFDLTGRPVGTYIVAAIWSDSYEIPRSSAFKVVPGEGPKFQTWLESPEYVRTAREYAFQLRYENNGDADMKAPLLVVRSDPLVEMGNPCNDRTNTGPVQLLAINPAGPAGTLPPGFSNTVNIPFRVNGASPHQIVRFSVEVQKANALMVDWVALEPSIRPENPPVDWDATYSALTALLGATWGEYLTSLANEAESLRRQGRTVPCARMLFVNLYENLVGGGYNISGRLVSAASGAGLPMVRLVLREDAAEASVLLETQTAAPDGRFAFSTVPAGTYELFAEGYYFDPPHRITVSDQDIVDLQAAAIPNPPGEEVAEPVRPPQSHPSLAGGTDGRVHLAWSEKNQAWAASFDGTDWSSVSEASDTTATEVSLAWTPDLGSLSSSPGLCLVYRDGLNNEARLNYVLGLPDVNGRTSWTQSTALTSDGFGDHRARTVPLPAGNALVLWLQRDCSIMDDDDLYYQSVTYPAGLAFRAPELVWPEATGGLPFPLATDTHTISIQLGEKTSLPSWIPCIGGKYGFTLSAVYTLVRDACKGLKGSAGLAAEVDFSDNVSGAGALTLTAEYLTDTKKCKYLFDKAALSGSLGATGKVPAPPAWGGDVNLGIMSLSWGVKVTGTVTLNATWKGTGFPAWPNGGSFQITVGFGPYGEVEAVGGLASGAIDGMGTFDAEYDFVKKDWTKKEWSFRVTIEASAGLGPLKRTFSRQWKWPKTTPSGVSPTLDWPAMLTSDDVETSETFTLTVEPLVGTGNQYEGQPVLGNIAANLTMDGEPSLARSSTGEILVAWRLDSPTPATEIGADIRVAAYNGAGFNAPEILHAANDFNRRPVVVFDSNDVPMLVYSSAGGAGISLASDPYDVLNAVLDSDVYYCRRPGGVWSAPAPLASLAGGDDHVSLAAGPGGWMTAAWVNTTGTATSILASVWNGFAWSAPETLASGLWSQRPSVAYLGDDPIVVWLQDDDGTTETINDLRMYYARLVAGVWESGIPVPVAAPHTGGAESALLASGGLSFAQRDLLLANLLPPGKQLAFPKPPKECCTGEEDKKKEPDPPEPPDGDDVPGGTDEGEPGGDDGTEVIIPFDPNEKVGPAGLGPDRQVAMTETLFYTVYFENMSTATAAAQEVVITDRLDENFDYATFRFLEVTIGDQTFPVTTEEPMLHLRTGWPDWLGRMNPWWADVEGEFNPAVGAVQWRLRLLDPATGRLPADVFAGLVPPNDETGRGEGHVSFSIRPRTDLTDNVLTTNTASIVFDTQPPILTNAVSNTIVLSTGARPSWTLY